MLQLTHLGYQISGLHNPFIGIAPGQHQLNPLRLDPDQLQHLFHIKQPESDCPVNLIADKEVIGPRKQRFLRLLQRLLGLPEPAYFHHRLIMGPDGRKLSKSLKDTGLAALREQGAAPEDVRRMAGL